MTFEPLPTFSFFQKTLPEINWNETTVLDFGGNHGNFLNSSNGKILEENYFCIDVDSIALAQGSKKFPKATWIYYNKYNPAYNPAGNDTEWPEELTKYDLIVSYSVFTHIRESEMIETINHLFENHLYSGGSLTFTFLEPNSIDWFLEKRLQNGGSLQKSEALNWVQNKEKFIMIDDGELSEDTIFYPKVCKHYLTFYEREYLLKLFSKWNPKYFPPVGEYQQSFISITKEH